MHLGRPAFALDPMLFGKGPLRDLSPAVCERARTYRFVISDDMKLFATTFVAGFLFVSMLIG